MLLLLPWNVRRIREGVHLELKLLLNITLRKYVFLYLKVLFLVPKFYLLTLYSQ